MTNYPAIAFWIFVAAAVGLIVAAVFFLRSAIGASIITAASAHARIYAVAYVKGAVLILIAMISSFDEAFHPLTVEQAASLAWWDWAILFLKPVAAGCAVLVAFLDRSTQRATEAASGATRAPFPAQPTG